MCSCMASILDASVVGDLQCEPNVTAGKITIITNNVTTNRYFDVIIIVSNSRGSHERAVQICKFINESVVGGYIINT